uniref:Uncharacterized protein n=1 Tax=Loa loa TaxID=7209 RepID=A0A1I7VG76_LOALO
MNSIGSAAGGDTSAMVVGELNDIANASTNNSFKDLHGMREQCYFNFPDHDGLAVRGHRLGQLGE